VTEFKYLTGQVHPKSTLVYEYPQAKGDPYYPVPRPENNEIYKKYKALADASEGIYFVGRLATYKYYNMDQVVAQALTLYQRLAKKEVKPAVKEIVTLSPARTKTLPELEQTTPLPSLAISSPVKFNGVNGVNGSNGSKKEVQGANG
jgi:UDP-galactopyranose mutase